MTSAGVSFAQSDKRSEPHEIGDSISIDAEQSMQGRRRG